MINLDIQSHLETALQQCDPSFKPVQGNDSTY